MMQGGGFAGRGAFRGGFQGGRGGGGLGTSCCVKVSIDTDMHDTAGPGLIPQNQQAQRNVSPLPDNLPKGPKSMVNKR